MQKKIPYASPLSSVSENTWKDQKGNEYSVVRDHGSWIVQVPCHDAEGRPQDGFIQWYDYTFNPGTLEIIHWLHPSGATHLSTREEAIMLLGMYVLACAVEDKGLSSGRSFFLT